MGCQGQRGRGVNKETESPRASSVVSGQWVAGASFLGWEEGRGQRPRKGRAGSSGSLERWPLSHRDTSSREQAFTSPPPPQSLTKATFWSGRQTSGLGQYCGVWGGKQGAECPPHRRPRVDKAGLRVRGERQVNIQGGWS